MCTVFLPNRGQLAINDKINCELQHIPPHRYEYSVVTRPALDQEIEQALKENTALRIFCLCDIYNRVSCQWICQSFGSGEGRVGSVARRRADTSPKTKNPLLAQRVFSGGCCYQCSRELDCAAVCSCLTSSSTNCARRSISRRRPPIMCSPLSC